jgi:hypothetical protein
MSTIWDHCIIDSELTNLIEQMTFKDYYFEEDDQTDDNKIESVSQKEDLDDLQIALNDVEYSCRNSLELLDNILLVLTEVVDDYNDVTGRTNSLMMNCEKLLEQQVLLFYLYYFNRFTVQTKL